MRSGPSKRSSITTMLSRAAAIFTIAASSLALAQAVPTIGLGKAEPGEQSPYRGSSVSYGHAISVYNPTPETVTWSHRVSITPQWHFNDFFFVRGRLFISQELTLSDSTTYPHEFEVSDLWLDSVWTGYTEKVTGLRLAGDLRLSFPTSKYSQYATRIMTVGPSLNLSRNFNVLAGLSLSYGARFTWRFNRSATAENSGGRILCTQAAQSAECLDQSVGNRNIQADLFHGPTVSFSPHERLNLSATFLMQRGWLTPVSSVPAQYANVPALQQNNGTNVRDYWAFSVGVTYVPVDPLALTLGAFSYTTQLGADGQYLFPLFNRSTVVSLDATIDIEATVSSITRLTKEQK